MSIEIDDVEMHLLLEGIKLKYGYDFSNYAQSSLRRRFQSILRYFRINQPIELLSRVLEDPVFFQQVLARLTVTTSEMFRDPPFFRAIREEVVPVLKTFPTINVWSAGCSTGEEVYSLSILLQEEALAHRSTIYATDINPRALKAARDGIFSIDSIKQSTKNYQDSGGSESFSHYYTADYGLVKMNSDLLKNVVFSEHNLVTDHIFTECHLILCRNVLIYFNQKLQARALKLFRDSLRYGGYLALGSKETIRFSEFASDFEEINPKWRVYRKTQRAPQMRSSERIAEMINA